MAGVSGYQLDFNEKYSATTDGMLVAKSKVNLKVGLKFSLLAAEEKAAMK